MILVVDDDALAGGMCQAILEASGRETVFAEGASEALARLEEGGIELVVSDHRMPGMSGVELFRELRRRGLGLPFILLSGDEPASLLEEVPEIGAVLAKDAELGEELPKAALRLLGGSGGGEG